MIKHTSSSVDVHSQGQPSPMRVFFLACRSSAQKVSGVVRRASAAGDSSASAVRSAGNALSDQRTANCPYSPVTDCSSFTVSGAGDKCTCSPDGPHWRSRSTQGRELLSHAECTACRRRKRIQVSILRVCVPGCTVTSLNGLVREQGLLRRRTSTAEYEAIGRPQSCSHQTSLSWRCVGLTVLQQRTRASLRRARAGLSREVP